MKKRIVLFSILLCWWICQACGQLDSTANVEVTFESGSFDFGKIKDQGKPVSHTFHFTNTGNIPVKIVTVDAPCGCTTPSWSQYALRPGQDGYVKVEFDPENRPGYFKKHVKVLFNVDSAVYKLSIQGNVEPKHISPEIKFPEALGNLRVENRYLNMGKFTDEHPVEKNFSVYNSGDTSLIIDKVETPPYVHAEFIPDTLPPHSEGDLVVIYNGKKRVDYGYQADHFGIHTNDSAYAYKSLNIAATVLPSFPGITAEDTGNVPQIAVKDSLIKFDDVKQGDTVYTDFTVYNTGPKALHIFNLRTSGGAVQAYPLEDTIRPADSTLVKTIFDTKGRVGMQRQWISLFSNDPFKPVMVLHLRGKVRKED